VTSRSDTGEPAGRWLALTIYGLALLLAEATWFSSTAVGPLLADDWGADSVTLSLLTVAVQLGFAAAALGLAVTGAADVIPGPRLFATGCLVAGAANLGFAVLADGPADSLLFRALTGAAIAAVYPVGMKLIAGWFRIDRGLAIGVLIGALTVGTALPHLFRAAGAYAELEWRPIVAAASVAAFAGAALALAFGRVGPFETPAPRFSLRIAVAAFREPSVRLANLGYLGHMWELFAMWTWVPAFLVASFAAAGTTDAGIAAAAAFVVVAIGGIGCVVAGIAADRLGRTTLTMSAMAISGTCALAIGWLYGGPTWLVLLLAIVWGLTVVADSAQFSTAVSELAPPGTEGSALALQTAGGFILTAVTILLIGAVGPVDEAAWRIAFGVLAIGPFVGVLAMWRLRRRPEAVRMAHGHR
jgi:MFS family permease